MGIKASFSKGMELGVALTAVSALILAGCGGGGGGGSNSSTPPVTGASTCTATGAVCGVAATGAAIGGLVYAYDATGKASPMANINADGTYTVDARGLTPPLMITTIGVANLKPAIYHSIATSADLNKNVNVTPLTETALAFAGGQPPRDIAPASMPAVVSNLPAAVSAVTAIVAPLASAVGATITNPLTDTFKANGTGMDKVLDNINVMPAMQGGTIDVRLVGNNVSLGTVTLPATAGSAATSTANPVTATQLAQAQKVATAVSDMNACWTSLTSLYATAIPTATQVSAYLDPAFKGFGMNATQFSTYFTTPASTGNGRGDVGLTWSVGAAADYDFTPPAAAAAATTALPAPVTFDASGNITAMWVVAKVGGFTPKVKMIKGAAYAGCAGGWLLHGNDMAVGDVDIIQSFKKQTLAGVTTLNRGVNVRLGTADMATAFPSASSVVVTGPGFATSAASGTPPTAVASVTLVPPATPSTALVISGTNTITLPYCQDVTTAGTTCFDETKAPAGALYVWSARTSANAVIQEWVLQAPKVGITWAQVQANQAIIFPTITGVTPTTATWLGNLNATANGTAAPAYTINFTQGTFASGSPSGYVSVSDAAGTNLQIFQNPASTNGTYTISGNKIGTYATAANAWGGIDSDFMGILVTTGGPL